MASVEHAQRSTSTRSTKLDALTGLRFFAAGLLLSARDGDAPRKPDSTRSFVTLDGLRGIAALTVVTRHAPEYFNPFPFFESYLAVDFFFALSGFVLAHAYGDRLGRGMSAGRFMGLRVIRLYPLYFLALILMLVSVLPDGGIGSVGLTNLFFAVLFLPSPASPWLFPLNGPAWSLFFELSANAAFGLMGRHLKNYLLLLIVGFFGLALLFSVYFRWLGFGSTELGPMVDGFQWAGFGAGAVRVAFSFFAGILVFRAWKAWHPKINVPPIFVVAALAAILVANPPQKYQVAFDLIATLLAFPALIFLGASSVPRWPRFFIWIGATSYAVYVLQTSLYEFTRHIAAHLPWTGAAFVVFVFGVATIADKYFDRPVRRALSARFLTSATVAANTRFAQDALAVALHQPIKVGDFDPVEHRTQRFSSAGTD